MFGQDESLCRILWHDILGLCNRSRLEGSDLHYKTSLYLKVSRHIVRSDVTVPLRLLHFNVSAERILRKRGFSAHFWVNVSTSKANHSQTAGRIHDRMDLSPCSKLVANCFEALWHSQSHASHLPLLIRDAGWWRKKKKKSQTHPIPTKIKRKQLQQEKPFRWWWDVW